MYGEAGEKGGSTFMFASLPDQFIKEDIVLLGVNFAFFRPLF